MGSKKAPKNKYVKKIAPLGAQVRGAAEAVPRRRDGALRGPPTGLNRDTVNRHHGMPRARIAEACEADSPFDGEVGAGGSCFGAWRARGARGRGARGEAIVFGPPKRGGKVCTRIVPDVTRGTSTRVVEGRASRGSIMCTDGFASCDGLVGWGCKRHHRVSRGENESVERGNPGDRIDGIESFWGYAKSRLVKYQGMPEEDFYLHLRECEFRFDMRGRDMYRFMLRELRERPLN